MDDNKIKVHDILKVVSIPLTYAGGIAYFMGKTDAAKILSGLGIGTGISYGLVEIVGQLQKEQTN